MNKYDNRGRFGAWRNKDRKEETHPHLTGSGEDLNGRPCWVSVWFSRDLPESDKQILQDIVHRYEGTSTKPMLNISIKMKQRQPDEQPRDYPVGEGLDDDIPF